MHIEFYRSRAEPAVDEGVEAKIQSAGDGTKLTVQIDAELHRRFKAAVAGSGKKMRDVVEEMIEQWTDANSGRP